MKSNKDYTINKKFPLSDAQNEVVEFLLQRNKAVNGCQTGFGKTYTTLNAAVILMLQNPNLDTVVCCPQCAIKAFKRELQEKLKIKFNLFTSAKPQIQPGARVHIITHTAMKKHAEVLDKLHENGKKFILLIDEAQIMHDSNNQFYQLVSSRRQYFKIVWEMTATPLGNNILGLYWLLYFLDPRIVGDLYEFKHKYCIIKQNKITRWCGKYPNKYKKTFTEEVIVGYKNLDKLAVLLQDYVILKQKHYNLVWHYHKFNITDEEKEQYLIAGQGLKRETSEKNFAVRLHDLQMVIDNLIIPIDKNALQYAIEQKVKEKTGKVNEELVKTLLKNQLAKMNEHRKVSIMNSDISSKEREYLKVIKEEIEKGHPVLTYLDYSDVVDRLEMLLNKTKSITGVKQVLKVTGGVSLKEREVVEEAIKQGTVVLITSAGTESINLQKSNSMVFYDVPFSVLTFIQAVGRITRIDSAYSEQHIHFIEATGTIDSYKRLLINMNANLIETIFGGIETLPVEMLKIDKRVQGILKQQLLWCFDEDELLNDEQINELLRKAMKERK